MSTSPPSAAAVLEYMCLFTHDLRRKQKRWQDGRLKYHAFNKRVMVHDERGNFVGDMHWRHDYAFDEGEEIELERGGVIVQVSNLVARRETDLSELLDKRVQEKEQRRLQKLARAPGPAAALPRPGPRPSAIPPDHFQLRHRPLHQVIGTPTGHHGKALVPKESPFEQRQQAAAAVDSSDERAVKRRKHDDPPPSKSGYAAALFGQSLTLSATPASSVPAKHWRLEVNLDPPGQADRPSATEELESISRDKQRVDRHLNHKSGYAQGLFGQSLTLSHTPVSIVPPRRQARHEPSPGSSHDVDAREGHDYPQPALREQPKMSRRFNQPASRPQTVGSEGDTIANHKSATTSSDWAEVSISRGQLKGKNAIPRNRNVKELQHVAPEDDDVIEIEDLEPVQVHVVRRSKKEKDNQKTAGVSDQSIDQAAVRTSRQRPGRLIDQEEVQESDPEKTEVPAQPKRTKSVTTKPATKKRIAEHAAPERQEDPPQPFATSRRADEHVTELKLKSRKRGLLMISDAPKKPRRQATGPSARPSNGTESQDANERDEILSDFPLINEAGEREDNESGKTTRMTRAQRTTSTELGEFNDLLRSSPPAPEETPAYDGEALTKPNNEQQGPTMTDMLLEPEQEQPDDDAVVLGEAAVINEATHPSPPPSKVYDPYRIPSSPEEEVPLSWPASSPVYKFPPNNSGSKTAPQDHINDAYAAGKKPDTVSKIKQQRPSRRRFVLEDDEEPYVLPGVPKKALVILDDTEDDTLAMTEAAPKTQAELNKTAIAKKRKSGRQDSMPDPDGGVEESLKVTKQKAKKQRVQADHDSQDEEARSRRRSTRQKRHRVDEAEEPFLASELDVSDGEGAPKKRQGRGSKASENRPRLERIKKNIKSRELIGFNLAALNAPLGPRGIGMPFSILSSPIDVSLQKRMSNQAVMEASSDPVVDEALASVPNEGHTTPSHSPSPPAVNTHVSGLTTTKGEPPRVADKAADTRPIQAHRENVTMKVNNQAAVQNNAPEKVPGSGVRNTMNGRSSRIRDGHETRELTGLVRSRDHHTVVEHGANDHDTTKVQAEAHIPQATTDQDTAVSAVSTDNPFANSTDRKERSNAAGETSQGVKMGQMASESTGRTQTTEAPVVAAAASIDSLQVSKDNFQRRLFPRERANAEREAQQSEAETARYTGSNEIVTTDARMALATPVQEPTTAIRSQTFILFQEDDGTQEAGHEKPVASEDIRVEQIASPATRPRVAAPFKKPTPALRRQLSTTTSANVIHMSSTGQEPDTTGGGQSHSAYASAAPSITDVPPQNPSLMAVRPSSDGEDNTKGESGTSGEKPEPNTAAPAALIQRQNSIGLRRPTATSRRVNNITGVRPQADSAEKQTTDSAAKATVKIVNPASRGRKAALASDAVGQIPQRVLPPTQPSLPVPISTADLACTPYEPPAKEPERPKRKMKFPGFQSAKGEGPWSREAFDLLESGRRPG